MSLARYAVIPRVCPFGGEPFRFGPLRLRDLARLEAWCADLLGDPSALLDAALDLEDAAARREALRRAYDAAEMGCPELGSPGAAAALGTIGGIVEQCYLSARRHHRGITRAALRAAAAESTRAEWDRIAAVAWCVDPLDAAQSAVDAEIGFDLPRVEPRRIGGEDAWAKSLWAVAEATGWTLDQILDLTLARWRRVVASRGEPGPSEVVSPTRPRGCDNDRFKAELDKRRAFWAEDLGPTP
jgi:hypothetical protein